MSTIACTVPSQMATTRRRSTTLGYISVAVSLIAVSMPRHVAAQAAGRAIPDSAEVELARVVGERLRREHSAFVVFPTLLSSDGNAPEGSIEDFARRSILLDALRKGAHAQYADTLAYSDDRLRPKLSTAERFFFTLAGDPVIQGDTATVDIVEGKTPRTVGTIERNVFRYWFVHNRGRWEFLRRTLLYST
jgi:hypothetical protein